ncbi:MAG: cytidylate kinase-like family protein [Eubacteriales bacterium]|nr:cytidylate kinase-like family protein [Eubacteriales bacterium]
MRAADQGAGTQRPVQATVQREAASQTKVIVTIGRAYGAGGRIIGKLVAERLGIPYYDSELLEKAAVSSGLSQKLLESVDEKAVKSSMLYSYMGFVSDAYSRIENISNQAQREIIEAVAAEGACVIVGRRADRILQDREGLLRVFITASVPIRAARAAQWEQMTEQESLQKVKRVDRERARYYNQHAAASWGVPENYDLCIDTDKLAMETAADIIVYAAAQQAETAEGSANGSVGIA